MTPIDVDHPGRGLLATLEQHVLLGTNPAPARADVDHEQGARLPVQDSTRELPRRFRQSQRKVDRTELVLDRRLHQLLPGSRELPLNS